MKPVGLGLSKTNRFRNLCVYCVVTWLCATAFDSLAGNIAQEGFTTFEVLFDNNQFESVIEHLQSDSHVERNMPEDQVMLALRLRAEALLNLNRFDESQRSWRRLLFHLQKRPDASKLQYARALSLLGLTMLLSNRDSAEIRADAYTLLDQGLGASLSEGPRVQAEALNNLWSYYSVVGDYRQAEATLLVAISVYQPDKPDALQASLSNHLGITYEHMNAAESALKAYRKALFLIDRAGAVHMRPAIANNIASMYRKLGYRDTALRYYDMAKGSMPLSDGFGHAVVDLNRGVLLFELGDVTDAKVVLDGALRRFSELEEVNYIAISKVQIAELLLSQGKKDLASRTILSIEPKVLELLPLESAASYRLIYEKVNEATGAQVQWSKLFDYASNQNVDDHLRLSIVNFMIRRHDGQFTPNTLFSLSARIHRARYAELNDPVLRASITDQFFSILDSFIHISSVNNQENHQDELANIFQRIEDTRVRIFNSSSRFSKRIPLKQRDTPSFTKFLKLKKAAIEQANSSGASSFVAESLLQRDAASHLSEQELSFTDIDPIGNADEISGRLIPGEAMLYLHLGPETGVSYFSTPHGTTAKFLRSLGGIESSVESTISRIRGGSFNFAKGGNELEHLVEALELRLIDLDSTDVLYVISDGFVEHLPLKLIVDYLQDDPLGGSIQVVRVPSASYFVHPNDRNERAEARVAVFGNTHSYSKVSVESKSWTSRLSLLPAVRREIAGILSAVDENQVILAVDEAAQRNELFSSRFKNSSILHIATHTYVDPVIPRLVGLVGSERSETEEVVPSIILYDEFEGHRFKVDLAIISGCETSRGSFYRGSGNMSLSNVLIGQGVNSTLSSLWPIPDEASARFMTKFYDALAQNGGDVSKALVEVQRQFSSSRRFHNPYYWAGFELMSMDQKSLRHLRPFANSNFESG